ncbi:50S ribosomal protein L17 [Rhynchospora pubera]|uniref:50S ribosomal protein L17 n=2 Tax=Rhynchospora pubera TaxID=906938 RepID=A0AAV8C6S3_9POAL|nr:50S ribosomal protein L17 [Rhynchospora pubera]
MNEAVRSFTTDITEIAESDSIKLSSSYQLPNLTHKVPNPSLSPSAGSSDPPPIAAAMTHRKLGRNAAHRVSMLKTMVSQLVKHERIETTVAKAKEVRRLADNMVQLGKEGTLDAARQAAAFVRGDDVMHKLFTELAYRYKDRVGGYTRILRTRIRVGDAAPMAYIEFVDRENELREAKPARPQPPPRPMDPWARSKANQYWASPKDPPTPSSEPEEQ